MAGPQSCPILSSSATNGRVPLIQRSTDTHTVEVRAVGVKGSLMRSCSAVPWSAFPDAIDLQEIFWKQAPFWKVDGHRWQTGGCKSEPGANDVHRQHTDHDGDPQGVGGDAEPGVQSG